MTKEEADELKAKISSILFGISGEECDDADGWWETSTGAEFGKKKLAEVLQAVDEMVKR